jgi:hypothetical protein
MGAKTSREPAVLQLEEHSGLVKTILDVIILPIQELGDLTPPWCLSEAHEECQAAEKYMLERYTSLFAARRLRAINTGNFMEALVWGAKNEAADVVIQAVLIGKDHSEWQHDGVAIPQNPAEWPGMFIEAIGWRCYAGLLRAQLTTGHGCMDFVKRHHFDNGIDLFRLKNGP